MQSSKLLAISLIVLFLHFAVAWNSNHVRIANRKVGYRAGSPARTLQRSSAPSHNAWLQWNLQRNDGCPIYEARNTGPSISYHPTIRKATAEDAPKEEPDEDETMRTPLWGRVKGSLLQDKKDDGLTYKQRLAKMGVATVLSYGMISNLSYAILIALAWYGFAARTKMSPLAPGQWKPFLGVYTGFWVFNNIIRPLRVGLSIAVAPSLDKLVLFLQNRFKISTPLAITVTVLFVNVIGTILLMAGGIALASLLAGVPIFPPKGIA